MNVINIMNKYLQLSFAVLLIAFVSISGCDSNNSNTWQQIRAERLVELQTYLDENPEAFKSFRTAPLAIKQDILNLLGFQMIVFRLLPEIFPEIWGQPEELMANVGLGPDPFDPNAYLPLGIGFALSETFENDFGIDGIGVNYATFTCMGCHSGKVIGPDGELITMIGGPNPLGDLSGKLNQTVNDPKYTAEIFRNALDDMPFGWVYGFDPEFLEQEAFERFVFNLPGGAEFFLEEVKFASNQTQIRFEETIFAFTYNVPNPSQPVGMPGSLDVFTIAGASACNINGDPPCDVETVLPQAPAPSDIPAAWQIEGRPRYQWDDSISNLIYREIAASLSVTGGDPEAINMDNVMTSGLFVEELPTYPYPFDVDMQAADRGAEIWDQACAGCHMPGNNVLMSPEETGTSPNRANVFTDAIVEALIISFREACPDTMPECLVNGQPPTDDELIEPTGGYIQIPLVGVWATAPYLHNGSVPTLYHLITGDRPDTFYRGNFTYDQELVGFTWDEETNSSGLPLLYDTSLDGYSNAGHTGPAFNGGIDWDAEPEMLQDLLEYLKTL
jgi:hypothetical protein